MSIISPISHPMVSQGIASLPKYDVNELRDLPRNAAPEGVLADGSVYYNTYAMLTPGDIAMVQSITGQSSVQGNALALAIGSDRAYAGMGWANGLTGNVTTSYLQSIEAAEANPSGNGTYDGYQISSSELDSAISYLTTNDEKPGSTPGVSISA